MNRSFSWRVFTSFGLFLSFLMILVSGVILFIFPPRAPGVLWQLCGLSKPAWQNQHIIYGFAFSILSLCHLFFINWKAFFSYVQSKTKEGLQNPRELLVIAALFLLFGFGTYFKIQPFSGILEIGKSISNSWENKGTQVPDKRVDLSGDSQQLAFAEITPEKDLRADDFYGYSEREDGGERHHGHGDTRELHHRTDGGRVSPAEAQLVVRLQPVEARAVTASTISVNNNGNQSNDAQAPDDELHRRTSASCASCSQYQSLVSRIYSTTLFRKFLTATTKASGCSSCGRCPQSGTTTSSAFGSSRASRKLSSVLTVRSYSPVMTSDGSDMVFSCLSSLR